MPSGDDREFDYVIGVGYPSMVPAQRMRIKRLRWLYERIKKQTSTSSALTDDLKYELMARFGLTSRNSGEYLRTLAGAHLIVNVYGRWMTRQQFLRDAHWNPSQS